MGGAGALVVGWTMSMAACLLAGVAQTPSAVDSDGYGRLWVGCSARWGGLC